MLSSPKPWPFSFRVATYTTTTYKNLRKYLEIASSIPFPVADAGEGPGGPAPLFLAQTEARRAEKNFETAPPHPFLITGSG